MDKSELSNLSLYLRLSGSTLTLGVECCIFDASRTVFGIQSTVDCYIAILFHKVVHFSVVIKNKQFSRCLVEKNQSTLVNYSFSIFQRSSASPDRKYDWGGNRSPDASSESGKRRKMDDKVRHHSSWCPYKVISQTWLIII